MNTEFSAAYDAAINAEVYHLVTRTMANAMVQGRKTSAVKGTMYGTYQSFASAKAAKEGMSVKLWERGVNGKCVGFLKVSPCVIVKVKGGAAQIVSI